MDEKINPRQFMADNGITYYALCKKMGIDPRGMSSRLRLSFEGTRMMDYSDYEKMVNALKEMTGKEVSVDTFAYTTWGIRF